MANLTDIYRLDSFDLYPMKQITIKQEFQLEKLIKLLQTLKHKDTKKRLEVLTSLGYTPTYKRVYKSGGVASYHHMKNLGIYRVVICATVWGRSTSKLFYCYAWCIEI